MRLVRILRSTVMVRVGGGWVALDEFLLKNDPCRGMYSFVLPLTVVFVMKFAAVTFSIQYMRNINHVKSRISVSFLENVFFC